MTNPQQVPEISAVDAQRLVDGGEARLIDVREDDEWAAGHAPAASHTPLGSLDPGAVPMGGPLVLVCRVGGRSLRAAQALANAGHQVHNLAGGMQAWAAAGLPVVRADGSAGDVI